MDRVAGLVQLIVVLVIVVEVAEQLMVVVAAVVDQACTALRRDDVHVGVAN